LGQSDRHEIGIADLYDFSENQAPLQSIVALPWFLGSFWAGKNRPILPLGMPK
jgi:hypothetical protein